MAKGTRGGKRVYIRKDGTWKGMEAETQDNPNIRVLPEWFHRKEAIFEDKIDSTNIKRETEKAILVNVQSYQFDQFKNPFYDMRWRDVWIPKSILMTESEAKAARDKEQKKIKQTQAKYEAGRARNERLVNLAKEHGVKGARIGLRTATLEEKLKNAGIEYDF